MIPRQVKKEDKDLFKEFCMANSIKHPYVFLDRTNSDNLSQSIKCAATRDARILGVRLFRAYNFNGLHVVDKDEFDNQVACFERAFRDKDKCVELESIISQNQADINNYADVLRTSWNEKPLVEIINDFIKIRIERASYMYVFHVYQRYVENRVLDILKSSIQDSLPSLIRYHRIQEQRYAFISTRELLEIKRHNEYCDLVETYRKGEAVSEEFKEKFEKFFNLYSNLDLRRLDAASQSQSELLNKIRLDTSSLEKISHDAEEIKQKKQGLIISTYYGLRGGERHKIHDFGFLLDRMDTVLYEESWGRQAWKRLNNFAKPYFLDLEKQFKEAGVLVNGRGIADLDLNELTSGILFLEKYQGGVEYENKEIRACHC